MSRVRQIKLGIIGVLILVFVIAFFMIQSQDVLMEGLEIIALGAIIIALLKVALRVKN